MSELPAGVQRDFPMARLTTVRAGGAPEYFARAGRGLETRRRARAWAAQERLEVGVVGSGSNLLVADEGVRGLVVKPQGEPDQDRCG